jgi:hypothetical protein
MQEQDVTITVYYYKGEKAWGQYILDTTKEALPILEDLAGFPYPVDYDVAIYAKREEETSRWGAQNLMERGIWINRDSFPPELIQSQGFAGTIIHENAHYWASESIYGKPWLKEGFCELFTYLTFERMNRGEDALMKKRRWSQTFEHTRYYNIPLDAFEYQSAGPGTETTSLAYSKSALFCYEIYERYGLAPLQNINELLHRSGVPADSLTYMNLLEGFTGEDQKELFIGWIFPNHLDAEVWQNAESTVDHLGKLVESASCNEETHGFCLHISTKTGLVKTYMRKFDFEKALEVATEEVERVTGLLGEFDAYALTYLGEEQCTSNRKVILEQVVGAFSEYESTEKDVEDIGWVTSCGMLLVRRDKKDFENDLDSALKDIKNGNLENAVDVLARIREEISKAKMYGGVVCGAAASVLAAFAVVLRVTQKRRRGFPG